MISFISNNKKTSVNLNKDICELFEEQAKINALDTAVIYKEKKLNYKTLNENANKLARFLVSKSVKSNKLVAIYSNRNIEYLTSVLGIFKSGGAYLPISPLFPEDRILYMIQKSKVSLILVTEELFGKINSILDSLTEESRPNVVLVEECIKSDFSNENLNIDYSPKDLAYVIFTSGSTGKPKGAMVERGGMVNHLLSKISDMHINSTDNVAQIASQCFDISVWQFLSALIVGGKTHIFEDEVVRDPENLLRKIDVEDISIMQVVPSMLKNIVQYIENSKKELYELKSLRWLALVGEALPPVLCKKWFKFYPNISLLNSYGPTECSDGVTHYLIYKAPEDGVINMPIGKPIANLTLHILEPSSFKKIPQGEIGELCISGIGVGRGYINDEEKTQSAFFENPFSHNDKYSKLYRTGDLVKYISDGNLEYLGRIDRQLKINGFRIELGEIEYHITKYKGIKDCVVVARKRNMNSKKIVARQCLIEENINDEVTNLVAYIVSENFIEDFKIKNYLKKYLPEYMIPAYIVRMDSLPLNGNGKIDVKILPEPRFIRPSLDKPFCPPRNKFETILVDVWESILNIRGIGVHDKFLELGGDSLLAMRTINKLDELTNIKLSFDVIFSHSVEQIAELIKNKNSNKERNTLLLEKTQCDDEFYPLSLEQKRLWFLWKLYGDNASYMLQGIISIKGNINKELLKQSWTYIIKSHDALRARFIENEGNPYEKFIDIDSVDIDFVDLSEMSKLDQENYIKDEGLKEVNNPFKLDQDLLFRIKAFKICASEYKVLLTTHEIIMDAWSLSVIMRQLKKYYTELYNEHNIYYEPNYRLRDYLKWETKNVNYDKLSKQAKYWNNKLMGKLPIFEIQNGKQRPKEMTYKGSSEGLLLDVEISKKLKQLSKDSNATLFMTLLSVFDVLLYNYTGQKDIIIGSPNVNRNIVGTEELVGFFLNMLPFRASLSEDITFLDLLENTKNTVVEGFSNSNYPFLWMVESADTVRNSNMSPIFQVMFNMYSEKGENLEKDRYNAIDVSFREINSGYTKYDLTLYAQEQENQIYLQFSYFTDLFEKEFIHRMIKNLETLICNIVENPKRKISDIEYLSPQEKHMLIDSLNNTKRNYDYSLSISQLFEKQVEKSPKKVAYMYEHETITYEKLNVWSNKLANYLKSKGVKPGNYVAICIDKSLDMIIGILAILKLGATYVPLDLDYPLLRLQEIIQDTNVNYLITKESVDKFHNFNGTKIFIDKENDSINKEDSNNIEERFNINHIFNIVYTSSSTGKAKGVQIRSKSVLNRLNWMWEKYPFKSKDTAVFQKSYALVAASWEIFGALLKGIPTLILTKKDILDSSILWRKINKYKVSYLLANPVLIQGIIDQGKLHKGEELSLRLVTTSAEPISVNIVLQWNEIFPHIPLLNLYGSTECSSNALAYESKFINNNFHRVPIGRPLSNTKIFIINQYRRLVPYGVLGEMCVSGECLSKGYLNLNDLNKEKFIEVSYLEGDKKIIYKTGDLARYMNDENIELIGRKDNQVKIRGFRVELNDIEFALQRHEQIKRCAVKLFENKEGNKYLVAYIEGRKDINISELRRFLSKYVPEYMIPSNYVFLDKLPLNQAGKVDRKSLREPTDTYLKLDNKFVPPHNLMEKLIARIWSELLRKEKIGIEDNFFDLGGHSLLAMQFVSKVYNIFNVEFPVYKVFEHPTISELVKDIELMVNNNLEHSKKVDEDLVNSDDISGIFQLTCGQRSYFNSIDTLIEPNRYNITRIFEVPNNFNKDKLKQVLKHLFTIHHSLRARFIKEGETWKQIIDKKVQSIPLIESSFENVSPEEENNIIEKHNKELQSSFDISKVPLIKIEYFNFGKHRAGKLLIITHHLISDGYSITIFMQELEACYKDLMKHNKINLPKEKVTIDKWTKSFNEYAKSKELLDELGYWMSLPWQKIKKLPLDYPENEGQNFIGSIKQINVSLDEEETNILIQKIQSKFNIYTETVLLLTTTKAISEWIDGEYVQLDVLGHGRDAIPKLKHLDLSNTLGFFAFSRHLVLRNVKRENLIDELKIFNEELNKVPNKGYGYCILNKFKSDRMLSINKKIGYNNEIFFNYRGEYNKTIEDVNFKLVKSPTTLGLNSKNKMITPYRNIIIDGAVINKCLSITLSYSSNLYKKETIEKIANRILDILQDLIKKLQQMDV
jgi:surfactin family lipopeptide synthetase A